MSIATATLYQLVWFYSNWRAVQRSGAMVAPFVRTLFSPLFCYALFDRVRWSTPHALADSLARCRENDWTAHLLPPLHDIDTWDDWQAYRRRAAAGCPAP